MAGLLTLSSDVLKGDRLKNDPLKMEYDPVSKKNSKRVRYASKQLGGLLVHPEEEEAMLNYKSKMDSAVAEQRQRMKEYEEQGVSFTVSQVETDTPEDLVERKEEILGELAAARKAGGRMFSALMVTDVTELTSILFVSGDKSFTGVLSFPKMDTSVYILKDIVSRKKQLMPLLAELVEKALNS